MDSSQNCLKSWSEKTEEFVFYLCFFVQGKGTGIYEQCYYGPQKQYRMTKLTPASRYAFRLAAKNDMGVRSVHLPEYFCENGDLSVVCVCLCWFISIFCVSSEFSEVVDLFTSCSVPLPPFPPELEKAGVTWLCLKWQRPTSSPKEDDIYYILEMEEEGSVCYLFQSKHFFFIFILLLVPLWNKSALDLKIGCFFLQRRRCCRLF